MKLKKLLLALVGLLIALAVGEVGLRVVYPRGIQAGSSQQELWPWIVYDAVLGWKNQANYHDGEVVIDDLHLRSFELPRPKRPSPLRLVCMGDSRTFGTWLDLGRIRYDNDYPRLLQEILDERSPAHAVEVTNAGVIGYTASHGLRQLLTQLLALEPRILVVGYGINEPALSWDPALRAREPRGRIGRRAFYSLAGTRLFQVGLWAHSKVGAHPPALAVPWLEPQEYAHALGRLVHEARSRGIRVMFLKQGLRPMAVGGNRPAFPGPGDPNHFDLWGVADLAGLHRLHERYQSLLLQVSRRQGVPLADAETVLREHKTSLPFGPYDLVHANTTGARLIAETVYEELARLGWLGPDDS